MLEVELVEHTPGNPFSGIGRYTHMLYAHLLPRISVRLTSHIDPPFTRCLSFLHHLPVGVQAHQRGSIVHFMEDLGCSQMLWRPLHPAIATSHDLGMLVWPPEARMHRGFDRLVVRLSYAGLKRMDAIITPSEFARQAVIRRLRIPPARVFAVHSGHDSNRFRPVSAARAKLAARYGLPDHTSYKYMLYVGSESPRKNMSTLLRALRKLPPNVRLLKVGRAGVERFRAHTNKLVTKYKLGDRVFFFEQVPDQDLPLFYSAADVYVCASFLEGFGIPIVEAMACGVPVVCSNVAALPEVAGEAAILVSPNDAQAFADAVLTIIEDSALSTQMAARSVQRAAAFSWAQTAEAVIAVYQRVAAVAERSV
jgi:glycosyltransferase involved in cell wall biosynthesis